MNAPKFAKTFRARTLLLGASIALLAGCGGEEDAGPEAISVIGSSTVYPFAIKVGEDYVAANEGAAMPVIESTGSGDGIETFCAGQGPETADIVDASRRMTVTEFNRCVTNGVTEIMEIKVGRDGVVFVSSLDDGLELNLTPEIIYRALAAMPFGTEQSSASWSDVDGGLPGEPILVYGPPASSGTRDALLDIIMKPVCNANSEMAALEESDPQAYERNCHALRGDESYISQGEEDDVIVRKVANNPRAVGVFGYSYLEKNADSIRGLPINGVVPTAETIADGSYPGSRGLYIYVKKAHIGVTPGLEDYLAQWAKSWSAGGPLSQIGLVPMTEEQQASSAQIVANQSVLTAEALEE